MNSKTISFMCVGDSITRGTEPGGGYRSYLYKFLRDYGIKPLFVGNEQSGGGEMGLPIEQSFHEGYNGQTISFHFTYQENTPKDVEFRGNRIHVMDAPDRTPIVSAIENYHPDFILLKIGTNNMWEDFEQFDPKALTEDLNTLLDTSEAHAPEAKIIMSEISTCAPSDVRNAKQAEHRNQCNYAYNALVRKIAKERKAQGKAYFLASPLNAGFDAFKHLNPDGIHPNAQGYEVIAESYFKAIKEALSPAF